MGMTYATRRRADNRQNTVPVQTAAPGPSLDALKGGAMPSQEQMGHRVDLPEAIREKMEASFGMDFSGVQLYESQTVADAGAKAVAMGDKIGFAPGQLDLVSSGGQAVLGHELSHIAAQARGEATGRGFLNDHALEARADQEGAMAAAGESVYNGPVAPLSATSTALSVAGPMQAKKDDKKPTGPKVPEALAMPTEYVIGDTEKQRTQSAKMAIQRAVAGMDPAYLKAHPEIMQGITEEAGLTANRELQKLEPDAKWDKQAEVFRGAQAEGVYTTAFNSLVGRKLMGQNDELKNLYLNGDDEGVMQRMDNTGVTSDLAAYAQTAFRGNAAGNATPQQKSGMVMQNYLTRLNLQMRMQYAGDRDTGQAGHAFQARHSIDPNTGMITAPKEGATDEERARAAQAQKHVGKLAEFLGDQPEPEDSAQGEDDNAELAEYWRQKFEETGSIVAQQNYNLYRRRR